MPLTQSQIVEQERRKIAALNEAMMDVINCRANPMTKSDLTALIQRRPQIYGRFAGLMDNLPD